MASKSASLTIEEVTHGDKELEDALRECAKYTKNMQLRAIFKKMDASGDGELNAKEFTKFLHKVGVKLKQQQYVKLMKCLDSSGDGSISYREFQAFVRVFQAEEDREAAEYRAMKKDAEKQLAAAEPKKDKTSRKPAGAAEDEEEKPKKDKLSASQSHEGLEKLWAKIGKYIDKKGGTTDGVSMFKEMFAKYDTNGDGELTMTELADGLAQAGITTSKKNFKLLMTELDKDGGGKISLKEFTKGMKKRT